MTRLLLATGNAHKVREVQEILGPSVTVEPHDTGVDETGTTFEENALIKARALAAATGALAVGDDSGIEIDHLEGAPGIFSARWTARADHIPRVLRELEGVPAEGRGCRFVCCAAAVWPDGREVVVRGTAEGVISLEARGEGGFGYDPIVIPHDGDGRTFGQMSPDEKHAISHRSRAFTALAERLAL